VQRSRLRRLHSIAGVVPLGVFLGFHLFVNSSAKGGADAYNATVHRLQQLPLLGAVEILCLMAPLVFHGVTGLFLIATVPVASERATRAGRALAVFQRVTGALVFAFVLFHLWTTRLVKFGDHESVDLFHLVQAALANPWIRTAYVLGILGVTGHLAAGLYAFTQTWDLARTPRTRAFVAAAAAGVFLTLAAIGLSTLAAFRLPNPV